MPEPVTDIDWQNLIGKRLVSDAKIIAWKGSPNSGQFDVVAPGKPTNKITGYIRPGFYQLETNPGEQKRKYVADTPKVKVVNPNAENKSSIYGAVDAWLSERIFNTKSTVKKQARFVGSGFKDSFNLLDGTVKKVAVFAVAILLLQIILNLTKR